MTTQHIPLSTEQMLRQHRNKQIKLADMLILRITNGLIDVFRGEGWRNQSRYSHVKGRWVHVHGQKLPEDVLTEIRNKMSNPRQK